MTLKLVLAIPGSFMEFPGSLHPLLSHPANSHNRTYIEVPVSQQNSLGLNAHPKISTALDAGTQTQNRTRLADIAQSKNMTWPNAHAHQQNRIGLDTHAHSQKRIFLEDPSHSQYMTNHYVPA